MKQQEQGICYENFARYLEKCGLTGKTLEHYPNAVDSYIPQYIRKYIKPEFACLYNLNTDELKDIYEQLEKSHYWEQEIKYKTWKVRLKALEYFISFVVDVNNEM